MNQRIIKRDSLSKQIADKLEHMIETEEFLVGQRIPTEPELMEMFQVSRNTIREAIQSLTGAGILEIKQGDGTYVRSPNRFAANMKKKYAEVSLEDIRETRNCLEVTIAGLAALRRQPEDLEKIRAALSRRTQLKTDIKENTKADIEFHMCIAEASHNAILLDLYRSIFDYLESHIAERNIDSPLSHEEIDLLHQQLFEAVQAGDRKQASMAADRILEI